MNSLAVNMLIEMADYSYGKTIISCAAAAATTTASWFDIDSFLFFFFFFHFFFSSAAVNGPSISFNGQFSANSKLISIISFRI